MRIGIIGCGYVLDKYMATWGNHPDLVVAGVTVIDAGRIDAVTRHYGFKGYADNAALLADPSIDIFPSPVPVSHSSRIRDGLHLYEHVAYHLSWMCAMFGSVKSVTPFSMLVMPDKTNRPLNPADTPDFSVASLEFHSGLAGRVTCSIAGPGDTQMRIIGDRGILSAETCHDYKCPVYLELFSKLSIKTKYVTALRNSPFLRWVFGVDGRRLPPVLTGSAGARRMGKVAWWDLKGRLAQLKQAELNRQDKCIGIADLAVAIATGRPQFPSHAFTLHMTELTFTIQAAGTQSQTHVMETTFDPIDMPEATKQASLDYSRYLKPRLRTRLTEQLLDALRN